MEIVVNSLNERFMPYSVYHIFNNIFTPNKLLSYITSFELKKRENLTASVTFKCGYTKMELQKEHGEKR